MANAVKFRGANSMYNKNTRGQTRSERKESNGEKKSGSPIPLVSHFANSHGGQFNQVKYSSPDIPRPVPLHSG